MINKQFDLIDKADIEALVSNLVPENRTLEYKQELPGNKPDDKKEFLADVSSFANASGGNILYGVTEQRDSNGKTTGLPERAQGLADINSDQQLRRLDEMIMNGIDPRINGIRSKPIDGFIDGPVILIRIPRSWSSPHRVIFNNHGHFYSRNSASKYQLDVTELRSAFTLTESLAQRIRGFRDERLGLIIAGETPIMLNPNPKVVLHLLPSMGFISSLPVDLLKVSQQGDLLDPIGAPVIHKRYNLDGFMTSSRTSDMKVYGTYLQVFRNGVIEAVDSFLLPMNEDVNTIPITLVEQDIIDATQKYMKMLSVMEQQPPIFIFLSLLGVRKLTIRYVKARQLPVHMPFDRDNLLLPDVLVNDLSSEVSSLLRPIFDSLWQAAGFSHSYNYDKEGVWNPRNSGVF